MGLQTPCSPPGIPAGARLRAFPGAPIHVSGTHVGRMLCTLSTFSMAWLPALPRRPATGAHLPLHPCLPSCSILPNHPPTLSRHTHTNRDEVYDGAWAMAPEWAALGPADAFGRTKLAGERAVASRWPRHAILRHSEVFGPPPPSPVEPSKLWLQTVDAQMKEGVRPGCTGGCPPWLVDQVAGRSIRGSAASCAY